jgi:hypothetical protein
MWWVRAGDSDYYLCDEHDYYLCTVLLLGIGIFSRYLELPPSTNKLTFRHVLSQILLALINSLEKVATFILLN